MVENIMFSVAISNPPYQDANNKASNNKLWPKFINKALPLCEWSLFITPDSWLTSPTSTGVRQRKQFTKHHNITYVKNTDAIWDKHCPIGVSTGFFVSQAGKYKGKTYVVDYDVKPRYHDLKNPYITLDKQITFNICEKIESYKDKIKMQEYKEDITSKEVYKTPQGGSEIHWSGPKIGYVKKDLSKEYYPKYVFPFSCSYKKHFWTDKPIGMLNHYIPCRVEDKHIWEDLMQLNVINYFCKHWNKTAGFTPVIKNSMLPNFVGMNNKQTYNLLKLTQQEIDEIENL